MRKAARPMLVVAIIIIISAVREPVIADASLVTVFTRLSLADVEDVFCNCGVPIAEASMRNDVVDNTTSVRCFVRAKHAKKKEEAERV